MARVAARVTDKRVLKLIRAFLKSGVMEDGLVSPVDEGTPQGDPLSPLLSNLVLDELDKELARRGHHFCRYADDCNIYVRSRRAGERVMASMSRRASTLATMPSLRMWLLATCSMVTPAARANSAARTRTRSRSGSANRG